jgi:hypothetical protein
MFKVGTVLFRPGRINKFATVVGNAQANEGFYEIIYDGDETFLLTFGGHFIEVNPDTPQNRFAIQLKYSSE